jgi:hypothetical protein
MRKLVKLERWFSPDCEAEYHYFLKEDNTSEAYVFAFNPKILKLLIVKQRRNG